MRKKLLLLVTIVLAFMLAFGAYGGKENEKGNSNKETKEDKEETNELEELDAYYVKKTSDDEAAYYAVHIDGDKVEYLGERYWKNMMSFVKLII